MPQKKFAILFRAVALALAGCPALSKGDDFFLEDLVGFSDCALSALPECAPFDFNGDGLVNALDYGTFQIGFLGRDCNGNRIADRQDIADQTSRDADDDGIPDECELPVVEFSQAPTPDQESVSSNIDWSDMSPNVVVADDFSSGGAAITSIRWWGSELSGGASPAVAAGTGDRTASPALGAATPRSSGQTHPASIRARSASDASSGAFGSSHMASVQGGSGDTCDSPLPIGAIPFSGTGTTCGFMDDYDEICDPVNSLPGSADVVYAGSPTSNVTVDISLCGDSAYDTKLYVYENVCGPFQSGNFVACNEDFCTTPSFPGNLWVSEVGQVPMLTGNTYFIVVDGYNGDCGNYTIDISVSPDVCGPGNGDCFTDNGTPGCEDEVCCRTVCSRDPFCCGSDGGYWDGLCATDAGVLCQPVCGPGNGDCFADNGTPGCEDEQCCETVCAADSFCCGVGGGFWDAFCGDRALVTCGQPPPLPECPGDSLSDQAASSPLDDWAAGVSDAGWFEGPLGRFESFDGVSGPICDVHWWGLNAFNDGGGFSECNKDPDDYEIKFHRDESAEPGAVVCSYIATPTKVDTGLTYAGFALYAYGVDLGSCCALESGWVSIKGLSSGDNCLFLWMGSSNAGAGFHWLDNVGTLEGVDNDLSLCLTGGSRIDGWLVSFHEQLQPASPQAEPLGLYFCDTDNVAVSPTEIAPCDGQVVSEHSVELDDCCLIHANPDSRSSNVPAEPGAFHGEAGLAYDIDIQAVTGHRFVEDLQTGTCVEMDTGTSAAGPFWAWHTTSNNAGVRSPLTSNVVMGAEGEWLYGPWNPVSPGCGSANMAFELIALEPPPPP